MASAVPETEAVATAAVVVELTRKVPVFKPAAVGWNPIWMLHVAPAASDVGQSLMSVKCVASAPRIVMPEIDTVELVILR